MTFFNNNDGDIPVLLKRLNPIPSPVVTRIHIWHLYVAVLVVSLLVFIISTGFMWKSLVNEEKQELGHANRIVTISLGSLLEVDGSLLKMAAESIQSIGLKENPQIIQQFLDDLRKSNPAYISTKIINPMGEVILTSSNIHKELLPNLMQNEFTSESFKDALISNTLVLGRNFFIKELNEWVIPTRHRVIDENNHVIAVLAGDIKVSNQNIPWNDTKDLDYFKKNGFELSVVRDDGYFQYYSPTKSLPADKLYGNKIDEDYIRIFEEHLLSQTGKTLQDIKNTPHEVESLIYPRYPAGDSIASVSYNPKYKYFILTRKDINNMYQKLLPPLGWMFVILVLFNIALFWLFNLYHKIQQKSLQELEFMAEHDLLTGLPNLRSLINNFKNYKESFGATFSVLFIDLDNFKNINDIYGHKMGDRILRKVSDIIDSFFEDCFCARLGGDEFIVVTPVNEHPKKMCDRFLYKLMQPIIIDDLDFSLRASIGIATYPIDGKTIEKLLSKADIAMYHAKRSRTGVRIYSKDLNAYSDRFEAIGRMLNHALERGEISVVYQPQVEQPANKIIGVESLIRWHNNQLGDIQPEEFIPIAESTGIILDIGTYVFEKALADFHYVFRKLEANNIGTFNETHKFRLSINVSTRQLASHNYVAKILSAVSKLKHDSIKIIMEITETISIDKIDEISDNIKLLSSAGVYVSLDDFGTGYSSLSHLIELPVDEVKIDKVFVQQLLLNKDSEVLVKNLIDMGQNMGINILAEGVENEEQLNTLSEYGCKYYQGYFFYPPMDIEELLKTMLQPHHLQNDSISTFNNKQ